MVVCTECNKKIGILKGYKHPIEGKKHIVCGNCFDRIEATVTQTRNELYREIEFNNIQSDNFVVMAKPMVASDGLTKWLR